VDAGLEEFNKLAKERNAKAEGARRINKGKKVSRALLKTKTTASVPGARNSVG